MTAPSTTARLTTEPIKQNGRAFFSTPAVPDSLPFLIREAGASDLAHVRTWLPEALGSSPAARLAIATDAAMGAVAGVASLRVFADQVGRFLLYVHPACRRRGCGAALLEWVQETARRARVQLLLTGRSCEVSANDAASTAARAFFQARGLRVAQEIVRYRAEFQSVLPALEPIYQRCTQRQANPQAARIVPAAQVDPRVLAAFAVRHVGGLPEEVLLRLNGHGAAFSPAVSMVALVDNEIVGALLAATQGHNGFVETRAVEAGCRGGWINLALMYHTAAAAERLGIRTIEFEGETSDHDTAKLARRLGATQIGCRQCWGVSLPASVQATQQECPSPEGEREGATPTKEEPPPLRSVHTSNFAAILQELGISLLVTTYQAGKLVMLRPDGERLNTHFRGFSKPMGLAVDGDRLAIGTSVEIWEYHNLPAVARRLEPAGSHDACFLPRSSVCTGDIQIHEMAWASGPVSRDAERSAAEREAGNGSAPTPRSAAPLRGSASRPTDPELWFVNTRFSCLCTRSPIHSFVPRWRPPFISALAPEDRCHLNGLCLAEGRPAFVTALGTTDTPGGWRGDKKSGGVLMEVATGEVITRGLSMPHSPRWYDGRLWVLESGSGGFGCIDPATGKYEELTRLPGFTRGLDFCGPLAFIGLSQVRESAVFSGIAIAERPLEERCCGVWVVNIHTGQTIAFVKFEDAVQEIFAVQVLPGVRHPDLINDQPRLIADSFVVPDEALDLVPAPLCHLA